MVDGGISLTLRVFTGIFGHRPNINIFPVPRRRPGGIPPPALPPEATLKAVGATPTPGAPMTDEHVPLTEPTEIGRYKVLDVLGEGGMGVVYLAEQSTPVRRRVALKILKLGMDSKQVVARFESERQALAVMDNPNIAKVLDSGVTDEGRPYFVMELVHGTPITTYADTHRLTTNERLRLFLDVCGAVQHAHHKGVIHRDLKPSNVLVTVQEAGPVVKVIDFGIAKAVGLGLTERTLVTRAGQLLGTPEYMSPEQAEMSGLDVDTRTDIYSLGVMLYELLVGVLPFDLSSKPDYVITHALRERDVPRPSTRLTSLGDTLGTVARHRRTDPHALRREVRGDLDWIILKAMEKDRTRRYETARGLANDIQRHLNDQPVHARPPSTRDRIGKFVRRNRTPVVAGAVALLAVLGGTAAATAGFLHAREEQRRAERSAATAEQVTDFLVDLFRVSDPESGRGSTITAREILDERAERMETELVDQPAVQVRLMRTMGEVYANLGLHDAATPLLQKAVAIGEATDEVTDIELALSLQRLAISYRRLGRTAEAESALQRALELSRGSGTRETAEYASIATSLGSVYQTLGRAGEAETLYREALAIQERLLGPDHQDVGTTLANLAGLYIQLRRPEDADPYQRRALRNFERRLGPDHLTVARLNVNLGAMHYVLGRYDEAEVAYSRAHPVYVAALGPDHPDVAMVLNNLGEVHWRRGDFERAEAQLLEALALKERRLGNDHLLLASTLKTLGHVTRNQGRHAESERFYRRALSILDRRMDAPDPSFCETLDGYSSLLDDMGRPGDSAAVRDRMSAVGCAPATP
jgi:eukaryotic-like serine/threonine-protein kinase